MEPADPVSLNDVDAKASFDASRSSFVNRHGQINQLSNKDETQANPLPAKKSKKKAKSDAKKQRKENVTKNNEKCVNNKVCDKEEATNIEQAKIEDSAVKQAKISATVTDESRNMPDVEENYIGMWDITDVAINKSYSAQKEEKRKAAKKLKRQEREQKKFNKVMKIKRKEAGNLGVIFDVETAKKEASREMSGAGRSESEEYEKEGENGDQAKNISYIPESKSEPDGEDNELHPLIENLSYDPESNDKEVRPKKSKKRKHSETKDDGTETTSKKSKKSRNTTANKMLKVDVAMIPTTTVDNAVKKQKQKSKPIKKRLVKAGIDLVTLDQVEGPEKEENLKGQKLANKDVDEVEGRDVAKKSKRLAKIKDEIEREEKRIKNEAEIDVEKAAKKARKAEKKARKEAEAAEAAKAENDTEKAAKKAVQKEKKSKKEKSPPSLKRISTEPTSSNPTPRASAEQWNPDALTGDAARKNKFLRLLGAGKTNISSTAGMKKGNGNKTLDVEKVQSELERQYEMGMKMKHDGGGKRRGLGA